MLIKKVGKRIHKVRSSFKLSVSKGWTYPDGATTLQENFASVILNTIFAFK